MQDFRRLRVWRAARDLALDIHRITRGFPKSELYGLTAQNWRAAISVGANIAEGCGRGSRRDLTRCLHIAMGSACELEHHLELAAGVGFLQAKQQQSLNRGVTDVKRMLAGLIRRLRDSG